MLKEIIDKISIAIDEVFLRMVKEDYTSFILFIGRADIIPGLSRLAHTDCVIDYQLDRYYDDTREGFYLRYLNRNYYKEGFHYQGESGIDDLHIELMIYMHLWDSLYFLKSLSRIAAIISHRGYLWKPSIPENGKWEFIKSNIVNPLKEHQLALGDIIEKAYSSSIRNSFAHSLFTINQDARQIMIRPRSGFQTIQFEDFQEKFLYSVILMNKLQNAQELNHDSFASQGKTLTDTFLTPDGVSVQIEGVNVRNDACVFPEFRMVHITE